MFENTHPRKNGGLVFLTLGVLYTAQFMPGTFMTTALLAILREDGVSLETLSFLYVLALVGLICVIFAPIVDRVRFGALGHYRGWLILAQSILILCLTAVSMLDPVQEFWSVFGIGLVIAVAGAFSAMATDGLACCLLPPDRRGVGNGIQVGGGFLGNVLGGGFILAIYPLVGWTASLSFIILFFCISVLFLIFLAEPRTPKATSSFLAHAKRFISFWKAPGGGEWLLLIALYPVGVSISQSSLQPMLIDAGWTLDQIGLYLNVLGGLAAMLGAMATGLLVRGLTRRVLLRAIPFVQAVSILPILMVAQGHTDVSFVALSNIAVMLGYSAGGTIIMTIAMDRTSGVHATTEYTIQSTAYIVLIILSSVLGLQIAGAFGYLAAIVCAVLTCLVTGLVVCFATSTSSRFSAI